MQGCLGALGRQLEYYDEPAVRKIVRTLEENDYRFGTLIDEVVTSYPFQFKKNRKKNRKKDREKDREREAQEKGDFPGFFRRFHTLDCSPRVRGVSSRSACRWPGRGSLDPLRCGAGTRAAGDRSSGRSRAGHPWK